MMAHAQDDKLCVMKFELVYFNFRGRAELSRLVFAAAGVDFEDKRVTNINEWLELKKELPLGQLPVLNVNGDQLCQSHTIARYLAKKFKLVGRNELEEAKCDMVIDFTIDIMDPIQPCYREKDQAKKDEMRENYENVLPGFMKTLEALLNSNEFFVGDQMTWADIAVMNLWHWIPGFGVFPKLHEYPNLEAHQKRIESHPGIKEWLERRPTTPV